MNEQEFAMKFQEAQQDADFMERLAAQDSPEKIQQVFAEKGIILTLDEVESLVKAVVSASESSDELSEENLAEVTGGIVLATALGYAAFVGLTALGSYIGWKLAAGKCK